MCTNHVSKDFVIIFDSFSMYSQYCLILTISINYWEIHVFYPRFLPNSYFYLSLITSSLLSLFIQMSLFIHTRNTTFTPKDFFSLTEIPHDRHDKLVIGIKWKHGCCTSSARYIQTLWHCWHPVPLPLPWLFGFLLHVEWLAIALYQKKLGG